MMDDGECGEVSGMSGTGSEILGDILPQYHFVHQKSRMTWHGIESGKPATKCLKTTNSLHNYF